MRNIISINPQDIKKQLNKILKSHLFENKHRPQDFLNFIVTETIEGRDPLLKGYTIGLEVFEKDETFDPQTDAIVRVEAGRLRRLLENYYMTEGLNDPVLINLPKGTYIPIIGENNTKPHSSKPDPVYSAAAAPPTGPAIAVLPFEALNTNKSISLFADGITEEIINHLSMSPSLYVISRKMTSRYKDRRFDIRQISMELETHYVLDGNIRQAGDNLRVNVQLLNGITGAVIWTEKYDYILTPDNLITVQDDIAKQVSATIGDAYGAVMRASTVDMKRSSTQYMEAYKSMLLFHDYLFELSPTAHLKARLSLEEAVKIDPNYPDAWAGLSFLALDEYRFSFNIKETPQKALKNAQKFAEKSITLSSKYSIAWYAMTIIHFHKGELDKFQNNIKMGLSIAPNSPAVLADSGVYLCLMGEIDQGLALVKKAMDLNPQHPNWCQFAYFHKHFIHKEYDKSIQYVSSIETPNWFWPHALQAINYAELGNISACESARDNVLRLYPDFPSQAKNECEKWFHHAKDSEIYLESFRKANLFK
jgi:TolB-like protein/Tfp pilus assembly protein PilF